MATVMPLVNDKPDVYAYSVKDIAEFCWRRGDLSYREAPSPTTKQGQDAHLLIQSRRKTDIPEYQSEVTVKHEFLQQLDCSQYLLKIRGRIDGLWQQGECTTLEEIKSTFYSNNDLPNDQHNTHLAQAKLYAAILVKSAPNITKLTIRITYWHLNNESDFSRIYEFNRNELLMFLDVTIRRFTQWLDIIHQHRRSRNQDLASLEFPFPDFREGQKPLAGACYHIAQKTSRASSHGIGFIHAATGIGKSVSTLFGTLKPLGEGTINQIWYLTAKTSGKSAINQAIEQLSKQNPTLKVLHLYNRESLCFCDPEEPPATPCQWQQGYFDRHHEALIDLFQYNLIDNSCLQKIAEKHQVCPYQLGQELLGWIDVVIGDFNYVFGFTTRNQAFFEANGRRIALLVDEAHNLPNRCQELYSASLADADLSLILSLIENTYNHVYRATKKIRREIKHLPQETYDFPCRLFNAIEDLKHSLDEWSQQSNLLFLPSELHLIKASLNQWLRLKSYCEDGLGATHGKAFSLVKAKGTLRLCCNNPATIIDRMVALFNSVVYFSGSLLPMHYFQQQLSSLGADETTQLVLESPFPPQRLAIAIGNLDTSYNQREHSITSALAYIEALYRQQPGLYLVCASSYHYLDLMFDTLATHSWDIPYTYQKPNEPNKDAFLKTLRLMKKGVAFLVMGGRFAEGIEWPAGVLKGVVILGTGMPSPSPEQQRLQDYFEHIHANRQQGFEFAYLFPGLNRIIQSTGRIQRCHQDAGIVLLLDKRFRQPRYQSLLPARWHYNLIDTPDDISGFSARFWDRTK